jgi:predicted nuclease with RNAse H fold
MKIVGVDLAGVKERPTGFAVVNGMKTKTCDLFSDEEILSSIKKSGANLITIDSPLGYPKGRCCLDYNCKCRKYGCMRIREKQMVKMGVRIFPCGFGGMQKLTNRGIRLKKTLEKEGYEVIETYPGSAQDLLGMPRKKAGIEELRNVLVKYGFKGDILSKKRISDHELDAITSALVGQLYKKSKTIALGIKEEAQIITARPKDKETLKKLKEIGII